MQDDQHPLTDNEQKWRDEILGYPKDDPRINDIPPEMIVGDKPVVEHHRPDSELEIPNDDGTTDFKNLPF